MSIIKTLGCLILVLAQLTNGAVLLGLKYLRGKNPSGVGKGRAYLRPNNSQCDYVSGSWIHDSSYSRVYEWSECNMIEPEFNCQMYGRPDSEYLKYRWQPSSCDLPRFDGLEFVERMRGKTMMFVGDSLGKNQWESLICMLSSTLPRSSSTRTSIIRGDPLSTFKVLDYSVTISFYKAPYLVDQDLVQGKRVLRLDEISGNVNVWRDVDVMSFNTGHWWTHKGSLQGWDYMESGGKMYQEMDALIAMEKAMRTWARWVDTNVDRSRTNVFFMSISPSHYNITKEGRSKAVMNNCYGETEPEKNEVKQGYTGDQMRVVESVLGTMATPAYMLDITSLSEMRKDCHPSIYSPQQRTNPALSADCSHWCLPGLPDTWNQLLYSAIFY